MCFEDGCVFSQFSIWMFVISKQLPSSLTTFSSLQLESSRNWLSMHKNDKILPRTKVAPSSISQAGAPAPITCLKEQQCSAPILQCTQRGYYFLVRIAETIFKQNIKIFKLFCAKYIRTDSNTCRILGLFPCFNRRFHEMFLLKGPWLDKEFEKKKKRKE